MKFFADLRRTPPVRPAVVVVSLLAVLGCAEQPRDERQGESSMTDAAVLSIPATARPQPAAVDGEGYVAVALSQQTVDIAAELDGQLAEVFVRVGDRVETGDPLARIEVPELAEELVMAVASLRALEAEEKQAEIDLRTVRERYQRRLSLADLYSREEVAALAAEQERTAAAVEVATARVGRERAYVDQLRTRMRLASVSSPLAGRVAVRYSDPGASVRVGTPVVRLLGSDELVARFAIPPEEVAGVEVGCRIRFRIPTLELDIPGIVSHISPQVDLASEMVFAEAALTLPDGWDGHLQSGLVGSVTVVPESDG